MRNKQIIDNVLHALRRNSQIFDPASEHLLFKPPKILPVSEGDFTGLIFYFPFQVGRDVVSGYKLKDGKGYISISETYRYNNTRALVKVAHVYRYITDEYAYECKTPSNNVNKMLYNFHYDMDLFYDSSQDDAYHPPTHLQVLHSHPRFPVNDDSVDMFIERVKVTCFDSSFQPLQDPMFTI